MEMKMSKDYQYRHEGGPVEDFLELLAVTFLAGVALIGYHIATTGYLL
jgi:hypothetical protein